MLDLLVGIPSVIFGLWGILTIVPFIRDMAGPAIGNSLGRYVTLFGFDNTSGYSVLAAGQRAGHHGFDRGRGRRSDAQHAPRDA